MFWQLMIIQTIVMFLPKARGWGSSAIWISTIMLTLAFFIDMGNSSSSLQMSDAMGLLNGSAMNDPAQLEKIAANLAGNNNTIATTSTSIWVYILNYGQIIICTIMTIYKKETLLNKFF